MDQIDFVITWVDGSDSKWMEQRKSYLTEEQRQTEGESRFRDWGNLKYWFRGVEQFAPWVHKIYFVTWGHIPEWLDITNPKLQIVKHEDYIPEDYLPTFSSHPIELNLHRIPGLSEHFVYFNDDTFITKPVSPTVFFKNGLPRDFSIETAVAMDDINNPFPQILLNNAALINQRYSKRKMIRHNFLKWFHPVYGKYLLYNILLFPFGQFSGFKYAHQPSPFLKSSFEAMWGLEYDTLNRVCHNRFRCAQDVNQYVMKYYQYMEGKFVPQSPAVGRFFTVGIHDERIVDAIRKQKYQLLCINDNDKLDDYEEQMNAMNEAFEIILPNPSSFEKGKYE